MSWYEKVNHLLQTLPAIQLDDNFRRRCMSLLDLTSLNDNDTESSIAAFCQKAYTPLGHVAGVCVYPDFIRLVADQFSGTPIKAITVANFPGGDQPLDVILAGISRALESGATEIDVVFPYQAYIAGDQTLAQSFVTTCKAAVGKQVVLKVILETGAFGDLATIAEVARHVWLSGADFIKTSTGKTGVGATLEAVATLFLVLKSVQPELTQQVGIKVSGGVKTSEAAFQYVSLAAKTMGDKWIKPSTFRIGASQLRDLLIKEVCHLD